MANLSELRIDETTWTTGTLLRRAEWRIACHDLLVECNFVDAHERRYALATKTSDAIELELLDEEGFVQSTFTIPRVALAASIDEYVGIIRRLDENAAFREASWFEAVDMAKKVVHDRAANVLARLVPELSTDVSTLRKLFTLAFSLFVDTTVMHHARGHGRRG